MLGQQGPWPQGVVATTFDGSRERNDLDSLSADYPRISLLSQTTLETKTWALGVGYLHQDSWRAGPYGWNFELVGHKPGHALERIDMGWPTLVLTGRARIFFDKDVGEVGRYSMPLPEQLEDALLSSPRLFCTVARVALRCAIKPRGPLQVDSAERARDLLSILAHSDPVTARLTLDLIAQGSLSTQEAYSAALSLIE
jgi:hypothetical protein